MESTSGMFTEKVKRVMIWNPKGGVGKTAISLNLALTFGYGIVTNDRFTIVDQVLEKEKWLKLDKEMFPDFPDDVPIIYDCGGFIDFRIKEILSRVQYLIMPLSAYEENLQSFLDLLEELRKLKNDPAIVLIINKVEDQDFKAMKQIIKSFYADIPVFPLKRSRAFSRMIREKKSIKDLCGGGGLEKYHFTPVSDQFNVIIDYLWKNSYGL